MCARGAVGGDVMLAGFCDVTVHELTSLHSQSRLPLVARGGPCVWYTLLCGGVGASIMVDAGLASAPKQR